MVSGDGSAGQHGRGLRGRAVEHERVVELLGRIALARGDLEEAAGHLRRCLAIREELAPGSEPVAEVRVVLALLEGYGFEGETSCVSTSSGMAAVMTAISPIDSSTISNPLGEDVERAWRR